MGAPETGPRERGHGWARLLLYVAAQLGLFALANALAGTADSLAVERLLLAEALWAGLSLPLTWLFWARLDARPWAELGLRPPGRREVGLAVLFGLGPAAVVVPLSVAAGHHRIEGLEADPSTALGRLALYALLALAVGVAEEVPFRGYLLPGLARRWGLAAGVTGTAALFTLAHLADPEYVRPLNVASLLLVGAQLALLRLLSGGLALPILTHALYDLSLFLLVGIPDAPGVLRTHTEPENLWFGGVQSAGVIDTAVTAAWTAAAWALWRRRKPH